MVEAEKILIQEGAPLQAWELYEKGVEDFYKGRYKEAIDKFKKALQKTLEDDN
jgi:outer membrane protein assembly factor BamD (BamD/ComL family)